MPNGLAVLCVRRLRGGKSVARVLRGALALLHVHKALSAEVAQADLVDGLEREDGQDLAAVHILCRGVAMVAVSVWMCGQGRCS